ncbi:MAG: metallopeptidase family protein [Bryobacterales bacterium]|nr:metallopeptidase family protein [Bryobacterales bacterium]
MQDAWSSIPESIREQFSNLVIAVEDEPTHEQLHAARVPPGDTLLGLYEGVPLKRRGWHYQMALPDQITLFQGPLERMAGPDVQQAIYETLWHELAHHIGMTEAEVQQAERRKFG